MAFSFNNTFKDFSFKKDGRRLLTAIIASFLFALNLRTFVRTGNLFPGGVAGLTILLQRSALKYWNLSIPYTPVNILFNLFPVYIGFRFIGKKFTYYSLLVIVLSSIFVDMIPSYGEDRRFPVIEPIQE